MKILFYLNIYRKHAGLGRIFNHRDGKGINEYPEFVDEVLEKL